MTTKAKYNILNCDEKKETSFKKNSGKFINIFAIMIPFVMFNICLTKKLHIYRYTFYFYEKFLKKYLHNEIQTENNIYLAFDGRTFTL